MDPGIRNAQRVDLLLRRSTRLGVVAAYATAAVVGLILVRPAFEGNHTSVAPPSAAAVQLTDKLRRGESVATFAARHGLDLGELLALNPRVDSLALPPGTKLRIG